MTRHPYWGLKTSRHTMCTRRAHVHMSRASRASRGCSAYQNKQTLSCIYTYITTVVSYPTCRVIFQSGGMCGKDWFKGQCIRMLAPERYTSFTATAQEAQWIFVIAGGGNSNMIRVRVYQQNGAVMVQAAQAKRTGQCPNPPMSTLLTQFHREVDVIQCSIPIKDRGAAGSARAIAATSTSSGFGVGSVQWMLAAEMSASLARAWKP